MGAPSTRTAPIVTAAEFGNAADGDRDAMRAEKKEAPCDGRLRKNSR